MYEVGMENWLIPSKKQRVAKTATPTFRGNFKICTLARRLLYINHNEWGAFYMLILTTFLLVVGVPLFLNWLIFFRRFRSGWFLLAWTSFTVMFVITDAFITPWNQWSYWSLVFIGFLTVIGVIVTFAKLKKVHWKRPSSLLLIATVLMFGGAAYFAIFNISALNAMQKPAKTIALNFPLSSGTFSVSQGGAAKPLQATHADSRSQKYALDLVFINENGLSYGRFLNETTKNELMLGMAVYSPCDGSVSDTRQNIADGQDRDTSSPLGNFVKISCEGASVTLAHLQVGSLTVRSGQAIKSGQMIGRVGLSGETDQAHLHIQAEEVSNDGKNSAIGMTFEGKFLWKNRLIFK